MEQEQIIYEIMETVLENYETASDEELVNARNRAIQELNKARIKLDILSMMCGARMLYD